MKNTKNHSTPTAAHAAETATPTAASAPAAAPMLAASPPTTRSSTQQASAQPVTGVANAANHGTKVELQTSFVGLIAGLQANYQPGDVFELPTGAMTRDQLIAVFAQFISAAEATKQSNQAWRQDVQAERSAAKAAASLRAALKVVLVGKMGRTSTQLLGYGFAPGKPGVRTTASKTAAVEKARATRAARGTLGKKQKEAITGNVTGVTITPVTAAPAASTPAGGTAPHG